MIGMNGCHIGIAMRLSRDWAKLALRTSRQFDLRASCPLRASGHRGTRLCFVCPVTDQRARILYLPAGGKQFASREAHDLAYRSQGESDFFRMITRAQAIRARLKGDRSIYAPFPHRPLGMHRRIYERLRTTGLKIEVAALEALRVWNAAHHRSPPTR
jgi:hypothetical protein